MWMTLKIGIRTKTVVVTEKAKILAETDVLTSRRARSICNFVSYRYFLYVDAFTRKLLLFDAN